jgi:prolyl-tRNA editing enzyme YbaK/EbsC (Cys-tRNA(Pro) deacylase)
MRAVAGPAPGAVAPPGHLSALPAWIDPLPRDVPLVRAAAGAPRHIFPIAPDVPQRVTGATRVRLRG